jgi:PIN domain nuclease of toxin-antitoxin system
MKLLLDTHALVWMMNGDSRLGGTARAAIASPANQAFVSAATVWEASIKFQLGKFPEAALLVDHPRKVLESLDMEGLPISLDHARLAGSLMNRHKDPFDRMLAAQALLEGLILVSADTVFDDLAVTRLW